MNATTPATVIRAKLNNPDAVIVRCPGGELFVVADYRLDEQRVRALAYEAPHCRDGRPFGHVA